MFCSDNYVIISKGSGKLAFTCIYFIFSETKLNRSFKLLLQFIMLHSKLLQFLHHKRTKLNLEDENLVKTARKQLQPDMIMNYLIHFKHLI